MREIWEETGIRAGKNNYICIANPGSTDIYQNEISHSDI